jgi:uroporphyrinogen-III synthase
MDTTDRLRGRTVGITADRRAEDQAVMWRRLGAEVIHGPAIRSVPSPDPDALGVALDDLVAAPPAWFVANTGYGVRALWGLLDEWGREEEARKALTAGQVVARGPKAAGALRSLGVDVAWRSPSEQLGEVAEHLLAAGVDGARIAFQLHGDDSAGFTARLEAAGAEVVALPVYRWVAPEDDAAAVALVEACCAGRVDALTFTSAPGVRNFVAAAEAAGRGPELLAAARHLVIGCVGPVCAEAAREEGFAEPVVPEHWRLGAMVKAVADALDPPPGG